LSVRRRCGKVAQDNKKGGIGAALVKPVREEEPAEWLQFESNVLIFRKRGYHRLPFFVAIRQKVEMAR
jgi:hypothetical protein